MKTLTLATLVLTVQLVPAILFAQGADMFRQNCGACHTVGKGKLVGPDLRGVEQRHPSAWLYKWIKSSQALVTSGDKAAVKLFADNSSIPMPDQALTDKQIKTILDYIKGESGGTESVKASDPQTASASLVTTEADKTASLLNTGFSPLVNSGTPAKFVQNSVQSGSSDVWQANKWFLFITIATVLVVVSTAVAFAGSGDISQEHHAKSHRA